MLIIELIKALLRSLIPWIMLAAYITLSFLVVIIGFELTKNIVGSAIAGTIVMLIGGIWHHRKYKWKKF